ncbi:MAG: hypothetical protein L6R41_004177 [Letrouitia leprolyta]|nr:MAG: hypothetical protein L6R41_004177 [Letrouitia leprolyta]
MLTENDCSPRLWSLIRILRIPKAVERIIDQLGKPTSASDIEKIFIIKALQQEVGLQVFKPQPYFNYRSLNLSQDTFRLCSLFPALNHDDPIDCGLTNEREIEPAEDTYEALSYTWGKQPARPRWIRLNGKPFYVQPNLFDALKSVRRRNEMVTLWIDAICINQLDNIEKSHQVSRMGEIFAKARAVIAWIGPEIADSEYAFRCLNLMALSDEVRETVDGLPRSEQVLAELPNIEPPHEEIRSLSRREYWQRAWIRQELLLAKTINIYCGTSSISWAEFGVHGLVANFQDVEDIPESRHVGDFYFYRQRMNPSRPKTLETLLNRYGMAKCSDLRDRVFSLLSLSSDCIGREKELVDYSIERKLLFYALLAFCKPERPSIFASQLQLILQVRSQDLSQIWMQIGNESTRYKDSPGSELKSMAIDYVNAVQSYRRSNGLPSSTEEDHQIQTPDTRTQICEFITRSNECFLPISGGKTAVHFTEDMKNFAIEDSEVGLLFRPTLLGYIYECCTLKKSGGCQPIGVNLELFRDTTLHRVLNVMFRQHDEAAFDADLVRSLIGLKRGERRLPATQKLCLLLDKLSQKRAICLIECRFIITGVFGYAMLEPRGIGLPD